MPVLRPLFSRQQSLLLNCALSNFRYDLHVHLARTLFNDGELAYEYKSCCSCSGEYRNGPRQSSWGRRQGDSRNGTHEGGFNMGTLQRSYGRMRAASGMIWGRRSILYPRRLLVWTKLVLFAISVGPSAHAENSQTPAGPGDQSSRQVIFAPPYESSRQALFAPPRVPKRLLLPVEEKQTAVDATITAPTTTVADAPARKKSRRATSQVESVYMRISDRDQDSGRHKGSLAPVAAMLHRAPLGPTVGARKAVFQAPDEQGLFDEPSNLVDQPQAEIVNLPDDSGEIVFKFRSNSHVSGPFEVIDPVAQPIEVMVRRSVLLRMNHDVYRTAVVDPSICNLNQFTPREVSISGLAAGSTTVTFWFKNGKQQALTYVVDVNPDVETRRQLEDEYEVLARILTELFPDSKVELLPVADKLIIRGQAKDAQDAAQIMQIIRGQTKTTGADGQYAAGQPGVRFGPGDPTIAGLAAPLLSVDELGGRTQSGLTLVNLLRVPGPQQIALKVKIAELNRSTARGFGGDVEADINVSDTAGLFIQSMLNAGSGGTAGGRGTSVISRFDGDDIEFGVRWLEAEGVIQMLSEPTLVTLSGRPATFVAGGEFAVPTAVGVGGIGAVTTNFRTFGAIISFLPVVIDKNLIRLEVSPEFSQINAGLSTADSFGLDVRSVTTTVEMREGQTLAIAGLIDDSMNGTKRGDLPVLSRIFGRRDLSRNETELIILVTPELIHPLDPEEVPPLPGFDVTEPTSHDFFLHGKLEGNPTQDHQSTVWPRSRRWHHGPVMSSGPFGHGQ